MHEMETVFVWIGIAVAAIVGLQLVAGVFAVALGLTRVLPDGRLRGVPIWHHTQGWFPSVEADPSLVVTSTGRVWPATQT